VDEDGRKEFAEEVTDQPSAAVIVARTVRLDQRPIGVIGEIMRKGPGRRSEHTG
jgi:hypothetical protein